MTPLLLSDLRAGALTLRLNRPERANAFTLDLIRELLSVLGQAGRDSQVRVIILTGAGHIFGAGQDIEEIQSYGEEVSFRGHLLKTYNPLIRLIRQIEKPILAAINGACAGASLGMALACDLRLAADTANLVVGFNGIGLVPDSAVSLLLPALVGVGRASEFTFTNAPISARQAFEMGLVNHVYPANELLAETQKLAAQLAAGPVGAFGLTKRAFNRAVLSNLEEALEYEADLQEIAGKRPEHKEGVSAFLEKRRPNFE